MTAVGSDDGRIENGNSRLRPARKRSTARKRLFEMLDRRSLPVTVIDGLAGDRPLTDEERSQIDNRMAAQGDAFFSDVLLTLTHQYHPPELAPEIWHAILRHKKGLTRKLGRNPGIAVAGLDYLTNVRHKLSSPTLISDQMASTIAEVAFTDGLTQLYDHQAFVTKLESEIRRYKRYGGIVSVMMFDVDNFKDFNDTNGHTEGDALLSQLAAIVRASVRDPDTAARYGGDEFAILLPQTDRDDALGMAERLRKRVQKQFKSRGAVTISVGIATCPRNAKSAKGLINRADAALYASKRKGGNCITACA